MFRACTRPRRVSNTITNTSLEARSEPGWSAGPQCLYGNRDHDDDNDELVCGPSPSPSNASLLAHQTAQSERRKKLHTASHSSKGSPISTEDCGSMRS